MLHLRQYNTNLAPDFIEKSYCALICNINNNYILVGKSLNYNDINNTMLEKGFY